MIFDNLIAEGKMKPIIVVMHAAEVLPSGSIYTGNPKPLSRQP